MGERGYTDGLLICTVFWNAKALHDDDAKAHSSFSRYAPEMSTPFTYFSSSCQEMKYDVDQGEFLMS